MKTLLKNSKLFSTSEHDFITCSHAESVLNIGFKNFLVLKRANEWDRLFTVIRIAGGNIIPCTSGENVVN